MILDRSLLIAALVGLLDDSDSQVANTWWSTPAIAAFVKKRYGIDEISNQQLSKAIHALPEATTYKVYTFRKRKSYPDPTPTPKDTEREATVNMIAGKQLQFVFISKVDKEKKPKEPSTEQEWIKLHQNKHHKVAVSGNSTVLQRL